MKIKTVFSNGFFEGSKTITWTNIGKFALSINYQKYLDGKNVVLTKSPERNNKSTFMLTKHIDDMNEYADLLQWMEYTKREKINNVNASIDTINSQNISIYKINLQNCFPVKIYLDETTENSINMIFELSFERCDLMGKKKYSPPKTIDPITEKRLQLFSMASLSRKDFSIKSLSTGLGEKFKFKNDYYPIIKITPHFLLEDLKVNIFDINTPIKDKSTSDTFSFFNKRDVYLNKITDSIGMILRPQDYNYYLPNANVYYDYMPSAKSQKKFNFINNINKMISASFSVFIDKEYFQENSVTVQEDINNLFLSNLLFLPCNYNINDYITSMKMTKTDHSIPKVQQESTFKFPNHFFSSSEEGKKVKETTPSDTIIYPIALETSDNTYIGYPYSFTVEENFIHNSYTKSRLDINLKILDVSHIYKIEDIQIYKNYIKNKGTAV